MTFNLIDTALIVLAQATTQGPASAATTNDLGMAHFLGHSDTVGQSLFAFLFLMSLASWYLIVMKTLKLWRTHHRSKKYLERFRAMGALEQVESDAAFNRAAEPFSHLANDAIRAKQYQATYTAPGSGNGDSAAAHITRTMRKVIDEETAQVESGLTVLASVGSTAPFVGLAGTVWGVYHALLSIGMSEGVTINHIAGPVGEALVMTGLGLAVAIPAVLAYNAFVRANRVYLAKLDAFAYDLYAFLMTGHQVASRHNNHKQPKHTVQLVTKDGA